MHRKKSFGMLLAGLLAVGAGGAWMAGTGSAVQQPGGMGADFGSRLVEGLKQFPGCHDAVAAQINTGQLSIIAWFEDRQAALRWYNSEQHERLIQLAGDEPSDKPMAHVPEDVPIMVMATLRMGAPGDETLNPRMPVSEISIEMYTPLPGGAMFGGRLTPAAVDIPHMRGTEAFERGAAD
ncbi:MAG: hypothetical protein AAF995_08055 [Planctomycetota bacterium]